MSDKIKISPWFTLREDPPVNIGAYKMKGAIGLKWWDGKNFMCINIFNNTTVDISQFNSMNDQWRGVLKDSHAP